MKELKRCTRCLLPETHESITFDDEGLCNICQQNHFKNNSINWLNKHKDLDKLVEQYRGKNDYDCLVPFSGGKDSVWTLYYLVKNINLNL